MTRKPSNFLPSCSNTVLLDVNPFKCASAADRYAAGRPYFHPLVMARIRAHWGAVPLLDLALDAGCGTGLSSHALLDLSRRVIAIDSSVEMLARMPANPKIDRILAVCEHIPLAVSSVDLITAGSVIHWLELESFTSEARRVLKPSGRLVAYDNYFMSDQPEMPGFRQWFEQQYLQRYPSPPRNNVQMDDAAVWSTHGFMLEIFEEYRHEQTYLLDGFVDYLVTQSNVIHAVEGGSENLRSARSWLMAGLTPFFSQMRPPRFQYSGPIAILHAI